MTLVTSRRRQHELLRSWSTWAMTSILLDPAALALVRETGWSGTHHADRSTGERIAGTAQGLGFGVSDSWHHPREVIAWPDIEAIAKEVPTEVRERLGEFQETLREHRRTYPRFAASADAIGCGPIVEGQPLTPRQEAYVRELEAFDARGVLELLEDQHLKPAGPQGCGRAGAPDPSARRHNVDRQPRQGGTHADPQLHRPSAADGASQVERSHHRTSDPGAPSDRGGPRADLGRGAAPQPTGGCASPVD